MGEEKRAHERLVVRYRVEIHIGEGKPIPGRVENLGALGAFVTTLELEPHIEVGDMVELTIWVPEKEPFSVQGQVLRLDQEFAEGDIRRAFAVKFAHSVEI